MKRNTIIEKIAYEVQTETALPWADCLDLATEATRGVATESINVKAIAAAIIEENEGPPEEFLSMCEGD